MLEELINSPNDLCRDGRKIMRSKGLIFATVLLIGFQISCASQDAVGKFAGSSVANLQKGDLVLSDMSDSCQRAVRAEQPIDEFSVDADTARSLQVCTDRIHTSGVLDISRVLIAYFSALGEVAASGTAAKPAAQEAKKSAAAIPAKSSAKAAEPAKRSGNAGSQGSESAPPKISASATGGTAAELEQAKSSADEIANILDQLATEDLRHKAVKKALMQADPAVSQLTEMLEDIVQRDYLNELLVDEHDKEANRFTRLAKNPAPKPLFGDLLTLNGQWTQVTAGLDARTAAAHAYIEALRQIRNGHSALVRQAALGKLKPKDLSPAMAPYSASLSELDPQIGRPF